MSVDSDDVVGLGIGQPADEPGASEPAVEAAEDTAVSTGVTTAVHRTHILLWVPAAGRSDAACISLGPYVRWPSWC